MTPTAEMVAAGAVDPVGGSATAVVPADGSPGGFAKLAHVAVFATVEDASSNLTDSLTGAERREIETTAAPNSNLPPEAVGPATLGRVTAFQCGPIVLSFATAYGADAPTAQGPADQWLTESAATARRAVEETYGGPCTDPWFAGPG